MKNTYLILFVALLLVATACKTTIENEDGTVTMTGNEEEYNAVIETEDGEVEISGTAGTDSWCQEGAAWNMNAEMAEGDMTADWTIDKLETSGDYEGYCHVIYTSTTPEGEVVMDYWFDESGEKGYYEMEINGEKFKQEWTA